jgi:hypothetical protein
MVRARDIDDVRLGSIAYNPYLPGFLRILELPAALPRSRSAPFPVEATLGWH